MIRPAGSSRRPVGYCRRPVGYCRQTVYGATAVIMLLATWGFVLTRPGFATHMAAHVAAVALAAPLLVLATGPLLARALPPGNGNGVLDAAGAPLVACAVELVIVWGWHVPAAHLAAAGSGAVFALEQGMFLAAGVAVWASALPPAGAAPALLRRRALAGTAALLATSMHMTLLGALLSLASSPWYHPGQAALWDQRLGGVIMLSAGGLAYLAGGLGLLGRALAGRGGEAA